MTEENRKDKALEIYTGIMKDINLNDRLYDFQKDLIGRCYYDIWTSNSIKLFSISKKPAYTVIFEENKFTYWI